jgi:hypothetical protein
MITTRRMSGADIDAENRKAWILMLSGLVLRPLQRDDIGPAADVLMLASASGIRHIWYSS